jgi:hypothetical protein
MSPQSHLEPNSHKHWGSPLNLISAACQAVCQQPTHLLVSKKTNARNSVVNTSLSPQLGLKLKTHAGMRRSPEKFVRVINPQAFWACDINVTPPFSGWREHWCAPDVNVGRRPTTVSSWRANNDTLTAGKTVSMLDTSWT